MEKAHCRVCYQSLNGMQSRCRQCGDVHWRRIWNILGKDALAVGGVSAIVIAMWALFRLAT